MNLEVITFIHVQIVWYNVGTQHYLLNDQIKEIIHIYRVSANSRNTAISGSGGAQILGPKYT